MRIMKGLVGNETQPVDRILLRYGLSREHISSYENLRIFSLNFNKGLQQLSFLVGNSQITIQFIHYSVRKLMRETTKS